MSPRYYGITTLEGHPAVDIPLGGGGGGGYLIAALAAVVIDPTAEQAVQVTGYWAAGDGGESTFVRVPSAGLTVDNGTYFASASPAYFWLRSYSTSITPQMYGAHCDGLTHPLSAHFALLAAAQAWHPTVAARITSLTQETDWVATQAALIASSTLKRDVQVLGHAMCGVDYLSLTNAEQLFGMGQDLSVIEGSGYKLISLDEDGLGSHVAVIMPPTGARIVDGDLLVVDDKVNPLLIGEYRSAGVPAPGHVAIPYTALDTMQTVRNSIDAVIVAAGLAVTTDVTFPGFVTVTASGGPAALVSVWSNIAHPSSLAMCGLAKSIAVDNLRLICLTGSAIRATTFQVVNCDFGKIWHESKWGLILNTYCQACKVDLPYFNTGNVDVMVWLRGNANTVTLPDKESAGTSTDGMAEWKKAYVIFQASPWFGVGATGIGNTLNGAIIEGNTSGNKSGYYFGGVLNTGGGILDMGILQTRVRMPVWYETSAGGEYAIYAESCTDMDFDFVLDNGVRPGGAGNSKIGFSQCVGVITFAQMQPNDFAKLELDGEMVASGVSAGVASTTFVRIKQLGQVFPQLYPAFAGKLQIDKVFPIFGGPQAGLVPTCQVDWSSLQQLLTGDPSFDGSTIVGWHLFEQIGAAPATEILAPTVAYEDATTDLGKRVKVTLPGNAGAVTTYWWVQKTTFAAAQIGMPFTFACLAFSNVKGPTPYASGPSFSGGLQWLPNLSHVDSMMVQTFAPQAAGEIQTGVRVALAIGELGVILTVDRCRLSPGTCARLT